MLALSWYTGVEWLYWLLLLIVLITGFVLNIIGLPGLWLMLIGHVIYGLVSGWDYFIGWPSVLTLLALAVAAEIAEFVAGAAGSAKAGGTKRGMVGAIVGGLIGGIAGTFIPVPVIGTIVGAIAGSFLGAASVERMIDPDNTRAIEIGIGAAKGRFWGIVIKSAFGAIMILVSLATALPFGGTNQAVVPGPSPATMPATTPSTSPATLPTITTAQ